MTRGLPLSVTLAWRSPPLECLVWSCLWVALSSLRPFLPTAGLVAASPPRRRGRIFRVRSMSASFIVALTAALVARERAAAAAALADTAAALAGISQPPIEIETAEDEFLRETLWRSEGRVASSRARDRAGASRSWSNYFISAIERGIRQQF